MKPVIGSMIPMCESGITGEIEYQSGKRTLEQMQNDGGKNIQIVIEPITLQTMLFVTGN
jgi:hypothetical protein